jgi:hypothetical protein
MIAPRKRFARGPKRPQYLANAELDKFMMMLNALVIEVSVVRERLDTHEALAAEGKLATESNIEAFNVDADRQKARERRREAMLRRIYRVVLEELEESREALSTLALEEALTEDGTSLPVDQRYST